jgi:hypothetical protein
VHMHHLLEDVALRVPRETRGLGGGGERGFTYLRLQARPGRWAQHALGSHPGIKLGLCEVPATQRRTTRVRRGEARQQAGGVCGGKGGP